MKSFNIAIFVLAVLVNYCTTNSGEKECEVKNKSVIIVGAGPSGIAAASKLFENGFQNVMILEAENRIGGRVYTTKFGDCVVDLGGQWVHGIKGNVAFDLADPFDLLDKSDKPNFGFSQHFFNSDGVLISEDFTDKLTNFFFEYAYEPDNIENATSYTSLGDYIEKMFEKQFKNDSEFYNNKSKYLTHLELFTIGSSASESWHDISIPDENDLYKECEGDNIINWKERGYSTILDILMRRYPDPKNELPVMANTVLDAEVKMINYSGENESPRITVTTTAGKTYKADHIIVTVSLGVLKEKYTSLFFPVLPKNKVDAIKGINFGNVGKVYLSFEKPFWTLEEGKRALYLTFIWEDKDKELIEADPEKMWMIGVTGAMTVEHKPNLLELWISGKYARIMESLPESKVFNHSVELLHRFLDKKYEVTEPIAILRTRWYHNRHFRGTYSYRSVETQKKQIKNNALAEPLKNMTVLFAGEATSEERYSTVDGAIGSGWRAANSLINYYCKEAETTVRPLKT